MSKAAKEGVFEVARLTRLADKFGMVLKGRLIEKVQEGKGGWDNLQDYPLIVDRLRASVDDGRWIDVANLASILWYQEQVELLTRDFLFEGQDPEHIV